MIADYKVALTKNKLVLYIHVYSVSISIVNDLDPNATLACYKCSGPQCADYFYEHQPGIRKILCEPGEICWVMLKF